MGSKIRNRTDSKRGHGTHRTRQNGDTKLLALGRRFDEAGLLADRRCEEWDNLRERAWDMFDIPAALRPRESDRPILHSCGVRWPDGPDEHYYIADAEKLSEIGGFAPASARARCDEIIAAVESCKQSYEAALRRLNFAEVEYRYDDANLRATTIGLKILNIRATTVEGLLVKARCVRWCGGLDDPNTGEFNDGEASNSLLRDLLALDVSPSPTAALRIAA